MVRAHRWAVRQLPFDPLCSVEVEHVRRVGVDVLLAVELVSAEHDEHAVAEVHDVAVAGVGGRILVGHFLPPALLHVEEVEVVERLLLVDATEYVQFPFRGSGRVEFARRRVLASHLFPCLRAELAAEEGVLAEYRRAVAVAAAEDEHILTHCRCRVSESRAHWRTVAEHWRPARQPKEGLCAALVAQLRHRRATDGGRRRSEHHRCSKELRSDVVVFLGVVELLHDIPAALVEALVEEVEVLVLHGAVRHDGAVSFEELTEGQLARLALTVLAEVGQVLLEAVPVLLDEGVDPVLLLGVHGEDLVRQLLEEARDGDEVLPVLRARDDALRQHVQCLRSDDGRVEEPEENEASDELQDSIRGVELGKLCSVGCDGSNGARHLVHHLLASEAVNELLSDVHDTRAVLLQARLLVDRVALQLEALFAR
mmetsp:Transcript_22665/g.89670  ORF Transcript_22665/g.89670 Transcript_22665/m.89670 type:complete len:426 (+) Transcript_22665:992-2269(+)